MPIYLSNNMIRFDDHSKLKEGEAFDIDGTLVDLTLVKSRSNKAGQVVTLVFNQAEGYDADLSLLVLLKEHKKLGGAGAYLYVGDRSDIKFAQKHFKQKLKESPELREAVMKEVMGILTGFIGTTEKEDDDNESFDITKEMLNAIAC